MQFIRSSASNSPGEAVATIWGGGVKLLKDWSGRRDSNPQPTAWKAVEIPRKRMILKDVHDYLPQLMCSSVDLVLGDDLA